MNDGILSEERTNVIELTEKGKYLYESLYSKPLIEDNKDPFDFFFEQDYDFDSLRQRKLKLLEKYQGT
jgi:hypothetical protein